VRVHNGHSQWVAPGYTSVTVTAGNRVLLYNRSTGDSLTGYIALTTGFHQQHAYPMAAWTFFNGITTWTDIIGADDGDLFFYEGPSVYFVQPPADAYHFAANTLEADGTFADPLYDGAGGYRAWTHVVSWPGYGWVPGQTRAFFYNSATGQAESGDFTPIGFTDFERWL